MSEIEEDLGALGFDETSTAPVPPRQKRRSRTKGVIGFIGAAVIVAVIVAAIVLLAGLAFAPEKTKALVGEASTTLSQAAREVVGVESKVILGQAGGQELIDSCPGYWVHMEFYNDGTGMAVPVYSAHNGCFGSGGRGDVILPLGIGDTLKVQDALGETGTYEVTEIRTLPQQGTTTDDIKGMTGPLILQTCYWDGATMKFVSVTPVA